MLTRKQLKAAAKKPVRQMIERLAGRIANPCHLRCLTCDRFIGHNHGCPGIKAARRDVPRGHPVCHVDFRTGQRQAPLDPHTGELIAGQEKFYETTASGHQGGCAWVAVRRRKAAS